MQWNKIMACIKFPFTCLYSCPLKPNKHVQVYHKTTYSIVFIGAAKSRACNAKNWPTHFFCIVMYANMLRASVCYQGWNLGKRNSYHRQQHTWNTKSNIQQVLIILLCLLCCTNSSTCILQITCILRIQQDAAVRFHDQKAAIYWGRRQHIAESWKSNSQCQQLAEFPLLNTAMCWIPSSNHHAIQQKSGFHFIDLLWATNISI
jgi:hypothetical protein